MSAKKIILVVFPIVAGLLTAGMGLLPSVDAERSSQLYVRTMIDYFRPFRLYPILVPDKQLPGDIYRLDTGRLVERKEVCFPTLVSSPGSAVSLRLDIDIPQDGLEGAIRFGILGSLSLNTAQIAQIRFRLDDARLVEVAEGEFQRHLAPSCNHLKGVVNADWTPISPDRKPPMILGAVLYARPSVELVMKQNVDANAEAIRLRGTLTKRPVPLEISASLWSVADRVIAVRSDQMVPVAFAPAFVPEIVKDGHLGSDDRAASEKGGILRWHPAGSTCQPEACDLLNKYADQFINQHLSH